MARAGVDRMKRPGWKPPPRQPAGDFRGHPAEASYVVEPSRLDERSPPRGGQHSSHARSTSTRWHRRPSNPMSHHSTTVDRTISNQADLLPPPVKIEHSHLPPRAQILQHQPPMHNIQPSYLQTASAEADYLRGSATAAAAAAMIPIQMTLAPPVQIQPEWDWVCSFARRHKCDLVDGVVCSPPDIEIVVGVAVKNEEILRMLEACERTACDPELNVKASLSISYEE